MAPVVPSPPVSGPSEERGVKINGTEVEGRIPNSRARSRRACSTVTWITTSGLARSISWMIFSATATLSGVSRMMMAFCEVLGVMRVSSSKVRKVCTNSLSSVAWVRLER